MPNYYAHLLYGKQVLNQLPAALRAAVMEQLPGFLCGVYGPDPLFFYRIPLPNAVSREGHRLHRQPPSVGLERLRPGVEAGLPQALGYALGYLCHYLLDAACHPYVTTHASRKTISHLAMEGEFDRYLMKKDGLNPQHETPLCFPEDPAVMAAAAPAYGITPKQFAVSMRAYFWYCRRLTRFQGTALCPVSDLFTSGSDSVRGIVLHKEPGPYAQACSQQLEQRLAEAVKPGAQLVRRTADCLRSGAALDFLPQTDYSGRALPMNATGLKTQAAL